MIADYIEHGWRLAPIVPGGKSPQHANWNHPEAALKKVSDLPPAYGVGLMHAYSGTCALDIDDWFLTLMSGINLDELYAAPDAVTILSGKPGHGKLLYRLPDGVILPTKQIKAHKGKLDGKGKPVAETIYEFRCATTEDKTVQDVLPPSIHPETKLPYQWGGAGHWSRLPLIPQHLLERWQLLIVDIRPPQVGGVDSSWEEIEGALTHISPDCSRGDWIRVGMALQWAGARTFNPEQALHIWQEWSRPSNKYPGDRGIAQQWNSLRDDKTVSVTLGTLFDLARQNGWVRPTPDASVLFGPVAPSTPTDIMQLLKPVPPPVDLDLWPAPLAQRAREVSEGVGCDPLVPLWAGIAAVCGVMDSRIRLELMPGFKVPPVLWLMTCGEPADKKTPGSRPMIEPINAIEEEDRKRFAQAMQQWEIQEKIYQIEWKKHIEFVGNPENMLGAPDTPPPTMPVRPVSVKVIVQDITSQELVRKCAGRPRGLLCYQDELSGWVGKITNKFSGENRSAWVVAYESSRYEMDRVSSGETHCDNFAVSMYGNIQPRVLQEHFESLTQDGLMQRFLPAVLRSDQTRLNKPVPEFLTSASQWEMTLRAVYAIEPKTFHLSPEAHAVFRSFQEWYENKKVTERLVRASGTYMTAFGKLEGLAGRLALVFHAVESPFNNTVSGSIMERVIKFIKGYVIPVYRHLYDQDDTSSTTFDLWVTEHIIHHADQEKLSLSDIKRSARRQFDKVGVKNTMEQAQWVMNSMGMLQDRNWVRRCDDGSQEHRGHVEWLISPYLVSMFEDYRKAVVKAKRERLDEVVAISGHGASLHRVHGEELLK